MNFTTPENIYVQILQDLGLKEKLTKNGACVYLSKMIGLRDCVGEFFTKGTVPGKSGKKSSLF